MEIKELMENYKIVDGAFDDLSVFDFKGVYIIYDKSNVVLYVGSCYTRNISERLGQYLELNDTGNTLMHAICKVDYNVQKVNDITGKQKQDAIDKIKEFKIKAIKYKDLEYQLINEAKPKYNKVGKKSANVE